MWLALMEFQDTESPSMNLGLRQSQMKTRQMFNKANQTKLGKARSMVVKTLMTKKFYSEFYSEVDIWDVSHDVAFNVFRTMLNMLIVNSKFF